MLHHQDSIHETYYDLLLVKQDATYEQIRASYRVAILNSHPDKLQNKDDTFADQIQLGDKFLKIQKAWEVLGNPTSRAAYDSDLRSSRNDLGVAEDVHLGDMMLEDGEVLELYYQCRCGDYFSVDCLELEKMGYKLLKHESKIFFETEDKQPSSVILPCGTCSLQIRLLIDTDNKTPTDVIV
ncbi:DNAJ heat shock N-terminal domain-containing protein [Euphorbia peplus]|nr:DNAJ heat shock N-terminal domain-containing protein [Euphorbia peplus]